MSWIDTIIGDQFTLQRGVDITRKQQRPGPVPVVSSGGIGSYHDEAVSEGPGVVIGRKGSLGTVFFLDGPYWPHDTTLWVKDFKGNDERFVYYFLKNLDVMHLDVGSANPTLNRNHVHPLATLWPPLPEQRRIAEILGALDDKIELNRKMNQTLEEMAQAIFKSWFIDFDGHTEFVDSELGRIPKGWRAGPLPDLIQINPRVALPRDRVVPYIDMKALPTNSACIESYEQRSAGGGAKFENGDTLLARITPCLENGKTAFVDLLPPSSGGSGSTEFIVLRTRDSASPEFAYCLARSAEFRAFAISNMVGSSGRQRVPNDCFQHFLLAIPPAETLSAFSSLTSPLFRRWRIGTDETKTLGELRDTLLPKLISGELRLPDAEKAVESVA